MINLNHLIHFVVDLGLFPVIITTNPFLHNFLLVFGWLLVTRFPSLFFLFIFLKHQQSSNKLKTIYNNWLNSELPPSYSHPHPREKKAKPILGSCFVGKNRTKKMFTSTSRSSSLFFWSFWSSIKFVLLFQQYGMFFLCTYSCVHFVHLDFFSYYTFYGNVSAVYIDEWVHLPPSVWLYLVHFECWSSS